MSGAKPGKPIDSATQAAYVIMSMDQDTAANVLRHMDESSIAIVSDAMVAAKGITDDSGYEAYTRLMADLNNRGAIGSGGFGGFRTLLAKAFGERKAGDMIERMLRSNAATIDVLSKADPKSLAEQVRNERPQVIAVLLGQMDRSGAVDCLNALPPGVATDVLLRYARLDTVKQIAITDLKAMLQDLLGGHVTARANSLGGVRQAADLLNGMGAGAAEHALDQIREVDPGLADQIRENMFTFDDLLRLPDISLQLIIKEVDPTRRSLALRAASQEMVKRVLANVTSKEGAILKDDIENGPQAVRSEVQAAQREYVEAAMRLAQEGRISLSGADDML